MLLDVGVKMKEVSDDFDELFKLSTKYYDTSDISNSYDLLKKVMHNWCVTEKKEGDLINLDIREHFKFVRKKYKAMNILIGKVDRIRADFMKAQERLNSRKEDLFKKQDVMHMDLDPRENKDKILADKNYAFSKMLPKETIQLDNQRKAYAYYMNAIFTEFERIKAINAVKHKQCITEYTTKNQGLLNLFLDTLNGVINFFSKRGKNKPGDEIMIKG